MKAGWTISAIGHAAVLAWGLVTFVGRPAQRRRRRNFSPPTSSRTPTCRRSRRASAPPKLAEAPKPLVEKIGEAKPTENPNAKVVDKPEIVPTADQLQPKPEPEKKPEPKKAEPKPPEPKPEPKQAFAKEEPKPDPIAEALKKDNTKPEKKPEKKAETPRRRRSRSRSSSRSSIRAASRRCSTSAIRSGAPRPAARSAIRPRSAPRPARPPALSQNELDALRARLRQCWNVPVGLAEARDLVVTVRILFNKDGTLSADPRVMNHDSRPVFQAASESALRAVRSCAPYSFLPVAKYEAWKDVIVDFDPRDMFRG